MDFLSTPSAALRNLGGERTKGHNLTHLGFLNFIAGR